MDKGRVLASKYQLVSLLAEGGMGTVWRARHLDLETDVAVKLVRAHIAGDELVTERFRREARAAAQLKSPHVVALLDYGLEDGAPYMVMELLEGEDLAAHLRGGRKLDPTRVGDILRPMTKALRLAHASGLVHRDLKPANVFLARVGEDEVVKVLDFGIAKEIDPSAGSLRTKTNVLLGSPLYMSPEVVAGGVVDHRLDLWSLAMMALEMLTGVHPFQSATVDEVLAKVERASVPLPSSLELSSTAFDPFFARALHPDPGARFPSASELGRAFDDAVRLHASEGERGSVLERAVETLEMGSTAAPIRPEPTERRPRTRWVWAALGALAVVPVAGYAIRNADPPHRTEPAQTEPVGVPTGAPLVGATSTASVAAPSASTSAASAEPSATASVASPVATAPPAVPIRAGARSSPATPPSGTALPNAAPGTAFHPIYGVPVRAP